jgi:hypothetical protein
MPLNDTPLNDLLRSLLAAYASGASGSSSD